MIDDKKWEKFHTEFNYENSSNLKINNPSKFQESDGVTLAGDWSREADIGKVTINGVPLKKIAEDYNEFNTDVSVVKFFREVILRDFIGNKDLAIEYLKETFHQRGLMYPVSTGLQKKFDDCGGKLGSLNGNYLDKSVNITTTEKGFKVEEIALVSSIFAAYSTLEKHARSNEFGVPVLSSDNDQSNIIEAKGEVDVDLSDPKNPTLSIENIQMSINHSILSELLANSLIPDQGSEFGVSVPCSDNEQKSQCDSKNQTPGSDGSNQMNINPSKLSSHLDNKSLFQILVDFLKSIFHSHNVQCIPYGGMASKEESADLETSAPSM
jgi:hypothetical protein